MAIKKTSEILESLRSFIGDRTDDECVTLLEDITDTLNDFETRTNDSTNWHSKYDELDASWRQKYRDRFFKGSDDDDNGNDENSDKEPKQLDFEDLFKPKEK